MPMKNLVALFLIYLAACSPSPEFGKYRLFIKKIGNDYSRAGEEYRKLSDSEKISVYIGASDVHPSDSWVMDLAYEENIEFLRMLRTQVKIEDDYTITFDFVIGVQDAARKGRMSQSDLDSLDLNGLCLSLSYHADECLKFLDK